MLKIKFIYYLIKSLPYLENKNWYTTHLEIMIHNNAKEVIILWSFLINANWVMRPWYKIILWESFIIILQIVNEIFECILPIKEHN